VHFIGFVVEETLNVGRQVCGQTVVEGPLDACAQHWHEHVEHDLVVGDRQERVELTLDVSVLDRNDDVDVLRACYRGLEAVRSEGIEEFEHSATVTTGSPAATSPPRGAGG
jgi:phage gp37-like protein